MSQFFDFSTFVFIDSSTANSAHRPLETNLPPEILGEIFKAYIASPSDSLIWEDGTVTSAPTGDSPMILGQICSYWRSVVLEMPTLWSSIFVEYPAPYHVDLVQMWLDRAGSCPLNLVLRDWVDSGNRGCSEGTEAIMKMFVERSKSWKSIDFVIELRDSSILDSLGWDACPILESASVCARYWNREVLGTFWEKLHRSPLLRCVDWYRTFKGGLPAHAPWAQLRHIKTMSTLSDEDVVFILQACPELSSLDIYYTSSMSLPPSTPIIHDRLDTLILNLVSDSTPLFDHISLPALQTLHLNNECGFTPPHLDEAVGGPIEAFLRRSQCTLSDLEILHFDYGRNIDELLQHVLYAPATRCLEHFDLYPIRHDVLDLDAMAEHPAQCVRDAVSAMEKEVFIRPREIVLEVVDMECLDDQVYFEWEYASSPASFGNDGMTSFQSHLAQLHLDD